MTTVTYHHPKLYHADDNGIDARVRHVVDGLVGLAVGVGTVALVATFGERGYRSTKRAVDHPVDPV